MDKARPEGLSSLLQY